MLNKMCIILNSHVTEHVNDTIEKYQNESKHQCLQRQSAAIKLEHQLQKSAPRDTVKFSSGNSCTRWYGEVDLGLCADLPATWDCFLLDAAFFFNFCGLDISAGSAVQRRLRSVGGHSVWLLVWVDADWVNRVNINRESRFNTIRHFASPRGHVVRLPDKN